MNKEQKTIWIIFSVIAAILILTVGIYSCDQCFNKDKSQSEEQTSSNSELTPPPGK